ncbi:ankyrin repeat domain-containing protein [Pedobacter metabolipauper]|uniref:Uncharacterized protein n=1 Tax=Pedobacter metabolipauper TaxID=425513 RepID=A0A4R6SQG9_9SPHI|nr:ankyrin repeat domain-containing protein [Pedobacter metabolipauper]TDQ06231.1 hypothetical protein ATK78_4612 [Pedobacter metabolipauper]
MIDLTAIRNAYINGKDMAEVNQMYKDAFSEITEEQQLQVWKQVCGFANFEMIDFLISQGWRAMGVEDQYGNTLLHLMAEAEFDSSYFIAEGRIYETTNRLLANKVSPLRKNTESRTALMIGAKAGYYEMLKAYQEAGAKIDWVDREGNTLLHIAARHSAQFVSSLDDAQQRLEANLQNPNFDPANARDVQNRAELQSRFNEKQARFTQVTSFVSLCMELGLDPDQKNNIGETAIDLAIRYKAKSIGAMLKRVDLSDPETTPLYLLAGGQDIFQACINQDLMAIDALIKLGENLNDEYDKEGDRYHGMSPLSIAIILHNFESVDLLLKNGADPMLLDSKSWHPFRYLYIPISNINTNFDQLQNKAFQKMLQSFVSAGFDINSLMDDEENTLLTISAKFSDSLQLYNGNSVAKAVIEEAIYADADLNKTNRDGISALMYLCLADQPRAEKELLTILEQGASTELRDKNGKTALMYACANSERSIAKTYSELLEQFGNLLVDVKDNSGKSALDYAAEKNNEPLVAWLLERQ